ncbi:MAG: GNAT family N-acetyltransferase [Nitrososphaera sp.]
MVPENKNRSAIRLRPRSGGWLEIQLSKAVAISSGVRIKMAQPNARFPQSANRGQPQYNTDINVASIRELVLEDLDNGFLESLDNLLPDTSRLERSKARTVFEEIRSNPLHRIFVAVLPQRPGGRDAVVGTTTLLVEPKFILSGGRVGHIEDVSVRRGYEDRGLGRRLVSHATQVAKEMGCIKMVLDCSEETMPFYEKLGYSYQDKCMKKFLKD